MTFRSPDGAFSLPFLNYTCKYNQATKYSTWNWTDPQTNDSYIEMPKCSVFCPLQPPEPVEGKMTRTWSGAQWAGSSAIFKCGPGNQLCISVMCTQLIGHPLADLAFKLPHYKPGKAIAVDCTHDNVTETNRWEQDVYEPPTALPQCVQLCEDPPLENVNIYKRVWTNGSFGVGTIAFYTCKGNSMDSLSKSKTFKFLNSNTLQ